MAILFFLALVICLRLRGVGLISSHVLGGVERDAGLYLWLLQSNIRNLFELPWFDTRAFYPYGNSLAWSDNYIFPSMLAMPLLQAGLSLEASYNLVLLLATFLNGYLTYRVAFRMSGAALPSVVSGAAFLSYSFFSGHLGHPQLQFAFFLPWAVSAIIGYYARPRWYRALICGLIIFLSFLAAVYFTIFAVIITGAFIIALHILRPASFLIRDTAKLIAGAALGLSPVVPFVLPYLEARKAFGGRALYEAHDFSATALSYFSATPFSWLYSWTGAFDRNLEAQLFPGFAVLILAGLAFKRLAEAKKLRSIFLLTGILFVAAALFSLRALAFPGARFLCAASLWGSLAALLVLLYRMGKLELKLGFEIVTNRALLGILCFCAILCFAVSLGPLGNTAKAQFAPGVYTLLYFLLPGMDALRAVSRTGVAAVLCLILTFPFVLTHIQERRKWRPRFMLLPLIAVILENLCLVYPLESRLATPTVFKYLEDNATANDVVAVLPFASNLDENAAVASWGEFAEKNVRFMNWAVRMPGRLVNGYSGQRTKIMREFPRETRNFPDRRSIAALGSIAGLRYIVFASNYVKQFSAGKFDAKLSEHSAALRFIMRDDQGFFLFEFIEQTKLSADFHLLVPATPHGRLHVELMSLYESKEPQLSVEPVLHSGAAKESLSPIALKSDGTWNAYTLLLPPSAERVRPRELRIKIPAGKKIYLRAAVFEDAAEHSGLGQAPQSSN